MARDGASDKGKATLVGRFFTALDDVGSVSQAAFKKIKPFLHYTIAPGILAVAYLVAETKPDIIQVISPL